jgi:hypothetical protein
MSIVLAKNPSLTTDSFEPFDVENYQKEIVWIISTLCICIPQYFNVVELSTVLLSYTYGVQILKGVGLFFVNNCQHTSFRCC